MQTMKPFASGSVGPASARRAASIRCPSSTHKHSIESLGNAAFAAASLLAATPSVAQASEVFSSAAAVDASSLQLAVGGGVAIAGLGAVLVATDPQKR